VLCYLLIFYAISPDTVFCNNVNERWQQQSQKMIAELEGISGCLSDYFSFKLSENGSVLSVEKVCCL